MLTQKIGLTNNRYKASQLDGFEPYDESIVFISYKRDPDRPIAIKCAEKLESIFGITYWIDEEDECLSNARSSSSKTKESIEIAKCIEKGLDIASALLGIIGPKTFDSPWIPYEIGGARGRQRFSVTYSVAPPIPHPLIAHLINDNVNIKDIPDFVVLGTPLFDINEVAKWARSVRDILEEVEKSSHRKIDWQKRKDIRNNYGVEEIYDRNASILRNR